MRERERQKERGRGEREGGKRKIAEIGQKTA